MARHLRLDRTPLGSVERTPQGGIRVGASLTRAGVFEYQTPQGVIREYRPSSEVARADSLATLRAAPITVRHPPSKINPTNFRQFSVGHVGDDVRMDGPQVAANVYIQDAEAIRAVEAGTRELSCGYHVDVDEAPGTVPAGEPDAGKSYDRIQRNMTYNHLALVGAGRAGDARLRLDAKNEPITEERIDTMDKIEIINGIEHVVGTPAHKDACERRDAKERERVEEVGKLRKDATDAADREKKAAERLDELEKFVKKMATPEAFDKAVAQRAAIVDKARKIDPEFKADGLTNNAIKRAAVAKMFPNERLDDKTEASYIAGLFAGIKVDEGKRTETRNDAADRLLRDTRPMPNGGGGNREDARGGRTLAQVREDSIVDGETRSARPLAMSRRDRGEVVTRPASQSAQLETMR